jgi:hypothetical protein
MMQSTNDHLQLYLVKELTLLGVSKHTVRGFITTDIYRSRTPCSNAGTLSSSRWASGRARRGGGASRRGWSAAAHVIANVIPLAIGVATEKHFRRDTKGLWRSIHAWCGFEIDPVIQARQQIRPRDSVSLPYLLTVPKTYYHPNHSSWCIVPWAWRC